MAESLVVSPVEYKNRAKNAYLRMKNCSPKFRSVLRQRYRERVENSRFQLLSKFRHIEPENEISDKSDTEDRLYVDSTTCKDVHISHIFENNGDWNLDDELLVEEALEEELSQYESWLLQEYELMWSEDSNSNNEVTIICPLCYSGRFQFTDCHKIYCKSCSSYFVTQKSMLEIENDIFNEVDKHKIQCSSDPAFVNVPGYDDDTHNNLCIVCGACSYLQIII